MLRLRPHRPSAFGDIVIVAFLVAQGLDGVFTYLGLTRFGPQIEANPFITSMVAIAGPIATLTFAKLVAATFGIVLHFAGVHRVVALLTILYVAAALVPWATIFLA